MKNAKLNVIAFNDNDVIATSGGGPIQIVLANFGNGIAGDATISANGKVIFTNSTAIGTPQQREDQEKIANSAINAALGTNLSSIVFSYSDHLATSALMDVLFQENYFLILSSTDTAPSDINGTYTYYKNNLFYQTN